MLIERYSIVIKLKNGVLTDMLLSGFKMPFISISILTYYLLLFYRFEMIEPINLLEILHIPYYPL
jgi:hypothetical protein